MSRPIVARIDQFALQHNLRLLMDKAPNSRFWAVVKARAYGHGIERVYPALMGADGFALLEVCEAKLLRNLGWRGPILLLEGVFDARELEDCSRYGIWHVVHSEYQIDWLAAHKTKSPHNVFLKLNSGMNRLGFSPAQYALANARLNALPQVESVSHMTHFANADIGADIGTSGIDSQLRVFSSVTGDLYGEKSFCNSAALLRFEQDLPMMQSDWVRSGIAIYGCSPDYGLHSARDWGLLPAMRLEAGIIAVQNVKAGQCIGYGGIFTADCDMRIGIVACGYADGYPRTAPTGTPVLIDGVRSKTLGRVSMDMICVDLSDIPQAGFGSVVTLWGDVDLSADEVAGFAGTLGYELLCAVAPRVRFEVLELGD